MLTAHQVITKGAGDGIVEAGDILIKVNNLWINSFIPLEDVIDSSIEKEITLSLQRGLHTIERVIKVQDLHSITPNTFVEVGGGIVHSLSYQMAAGYQVPTGSVFVASSGYMMGLAGISRQCVIESLNNIITPDLDSFIAIMNTLKDNERVAVLYISFNLVIMH